MAVISSYATLQTAVGDYLARSDLTSFIPNFIQNCENKVYRTLNIRAEETALSLTVTSGVAATPTGYKALKFAYVNEAPAQLLQPVPIEDIYRKYPTRSGAETPKFIAREGSNFTFGPYAKDCTVSGIYYKKLDPLRTTDSTWYVVNAPEVLLYGSLLESAPFIKDDPRLQTWGQLYQDALDTVRKYESQENISGGTLRMMAG